MSSSPAWCCARERGLGVIFITHNPHHAYPVGDRFLLLKRGQSLGYYRKNEVTRDELTALMAGGAELEELSHELEQGGAGSAAAARYPRTISVVPIAMRRAGAALRATWRTTLVHRMIAAP